ncbi:MAG: PAS domain S-box protein [Bacteroidetes bacterium]|nr:PAS domain S-box protein [Bacteroidota bacterium]
MPRTPAINAQMLATLRRTAAGFAFLALAIGAAGIAGWVLDISYLRNFAPDHIPIRFNSSIGIILLAVSLLLRQRQNDNTAVRISANIAAGLAIALGAATLAEHIFDVNLVIDEALWKLPSNSPQHLGRISAAAALLFVILGAGLLRYGVWWSQVCSLTTAFMGFGVAAGYLLESSWTQRAEDLPISLNAALAGIALGISAIMGASKGLPELLSSNTQSGRTLRIMLPIMVVLLVAVELTEEAPRLLGANNSVLMSAALSMTIFGILAYYNIRTMRRAEYLQIGKERAVNVVNIVTDGIISIDSDLKIILANPAAQRIFGYTESELLGKDSEILIPERRRDEHRAKIEKYAVAAAESTQWTYDMNGAYGMRSDGSEFPMEISVSQTIVENQKVFTFIFRDISERKQSEIMERRLAAVVNSSADGIIGTDPDGIIQSWNRGAEQIYGYTAEEAVGRHINFVVPQEKEKETSEIIEKVLSGRSVTNLYVERVKSDGTRLILLLSASPIHDESGTIVGMSSIIRNMTELSEKDITLRKSEERYDTLFKNLLEGYALFRLDRNEDGIPIDFTFLDINPAFEAMTGLGDVIGKRISDVEPTIYEMYPTIPERCEQMAKEGKARRFESFMPTLNKRFYVLAFSPSPDHFITMFSDVTDIKQAEEDLRQSEHRYDALFKNLLEGYALFRVVRNENNEPYDLEYITVNPAFTAILGLNDVVGKRVSEVFPGVFELYSGILGKNYEEMLETAKSRQAEIYLPAFSKWFLIMSFSPSPEYFITVFSDITDKKQAEEDLRNSEKRYRELFENMSEGYVYAQILCDESGRPEDILCIAINPSGEKMTKWSGLAGRKIGSALPGFWESNRDILEGWSDVAFGGVPQRLEKYVSELNSWYSVSLSSPATGYINAIFEDVTERKQAEEKLRQSEMLYRTMFENISEGYVLSRILYDEDGRPEDMMCLAINPAAEQLTGWRGLGGKKINDELPGFWTRNREILERWNNVIVSGKPRRFENYVSELNQWVSVSLSNPAPEHIVVIFSDITERKQAEEKLRRSREQLLAFVRETPMNLAMLDRELRYIVVSQHWLDYFGKTDEEIIGKPHHEILPGMPEVWYEQHLRGLEGELYKSDEDLWEMPDGSRKWLRRSIAPWHDTDGTIGGIIIAAENITKFKEADEARRQSEELFRAIAESTIDYISVLDINAKRLYISPSYSSVLGKRDNPTGTTIFGDLHPDDRERARTALGDVFKSGTVKTGEFRMLSSDGSIRDTDVSGSPVFDKSGKVMQVVVIVRDITEKKRAEMQMRRAQRLESIGTLAGGIAHDLNNILTPIMLSFEILSVRFPDEKTAEILSMLKSSVKRGSDMVKQVLSFARGTEGEQTIVQVRHIIVEIVKIIKEIFPKNIILRKNIADDLPTILADPTQLHQVLMNLCVNARDAMPNGGIIDIKAESVTIDEQYARMQLDAKPGFYVAISVADQGTGIPPAVLERLFEPFFTTKEVGKGTGLGLPSVLSIVKGHEGFINVYSEVGKGSTFKVYIPAMIDEDKLPQKQEQREEEKEIAGNGQIILVIDDEAAILEITRQTLESNNYRVITATDGAEGVAVYAKQHSEISLVITDIEMPYMNGRAAIQAMQRIKPDVKVIAVSGFTQNGNKLEKTANIRFLDKPYTSEKLLRAMRNMLG